MSRIRRRSLMLAASGLVAAAVTATVPASPAQAATYTMTITAPVPGGIGVDAIYQNGGAGGANYDIDPCTAGTNPTLQWNGSGNLVGQNNVTDNIGLGPLTKVRFELYPGVCGTYSPWNDVGGVAIEIDASIRNLGNITLPVAGQNGAFRIDGDILSSTPIADGRVKVDSFQAPTFFPDPDKPLQSNGIVEYGSFASGSSLGTKWTAGVGWDGLYVLFVEDTVTKRKIVTLQFISPTTIPTVDLDAICFGFDTCTQSAGDPPPTSGAFHPTTPTRILDTRFGLGISDAVRTGDGRSSSPNPITRRDEAANHELKVTGLGDIPEAGVSAVLLNVTAVGAPGQGFISVIPKPARFGNIYDDQASYGAIPNTSNLNLATGTPTPNLVLARVGAGGKIRIYNSFGPTGLIADVAGWFGTGGAHLDGAGFEGVTPTRLMDTRQPGGGGRFAANEIRNLTVAGVAGIPANAESVVVNITSVQPSNSSYVTAFPTGEAPPNASNVNNVAFGTRANLGVVKVGAGGQISILSAESDADILVDIMGSFGPYGGKVTSIVPERFADSRIGFGTTQGPLGPNESRSIAIRGVGSVPANATGIIVNLTAVNPSGGGYMTLWPTGGDRPVVSNVNFGPGQTVPGLAILQIGADGTVSVFSEVGFTDFLIDVMGYVS